MSSPPSLATTHSPPYRRWFCYLAIFIMIALASPYFANQDARVHSPNVAIYSEINGKQEPMTQKVWFDGRFYAKFETRSVWIWLGAILVAADATCFGIRRLLARRNVNRR